MDKSLRLDYSKLPKTIGIVGSREFPSCVWVDEFVKKLRGGTVVVSGGAIGVDKHAENAARKRGLPEPIVLRPQEDVIDKSGYVAALLARNTDIVLEVKGEDGIVFCFLLVPPRTGGSDDTRKKCDKLEVPCVTFRMNKEGSWLETQTNQHFQLHPIYGKMWKDKWPATKSTAEAKKSSQKQ